MDNKISINKIIADIKATKGNRSGCQGLHSSLESDGYITSICKWTRATSPERIDALIEHIEKQEAALIAWKKNMMEVCGEDGPASVANEIRALKALRDTAMLALKSQVEQLAAENVGLKLKGRELLNEASKVYQKYNATIDFYSGDFMDGQTLHEFQFVLDADTPTTDRIVAGIKADGVEDMANHFFKLAKDEANSLIAEQWRVSGRVANEQAKQLREGAK